MLSRLLGNDQIPAVGAFGILRLQGKEKGHKK
uniref:Uncharacterized protein n=1 Tax=Rhizophora mucronata TaxID=61149 RepID=A0A2P2PZN3_RHIMU